jgi:DNA-directed RNA polymerase
MIESYRDTEDLRFFSPERLQEQLRREADLIKAGKDRYEKRLKTKSAIDTSPGLRLMEETLQDVVDKIEMSKAERAGKRGQPRGWWRLLKDVDTEIMAWQALAGALNAAKEYQNHTTASRHVGEQLAAHLQLEAMEQEEAGLVRQHEKYARKHNRDDVRARKMSKLADNFGYKAPSWDEDECIIIGEFLLGEVEGATRLIHRVNVKKSDGGHRQLKMAFRNETQEEWDKANTLIGEMLPVSLPMLVPPVPWTNNSDGGLVIPHKNVKLLNEKQFTNPAGIRSLSQENCPVTFSALTAMQDSAYRINESVRRVMQDCLDTRDPMAPSKLNVPKVTTQMPKELNEKADADILTEEEEVEFNRICTARGKEYAAKNRAETEWTTFRDSLRQAWLLDEETFWYSAQIDGRGRMYYRSAHLNPQGCGINKGLLEFAEPVRLGEQGVLWLMVHVANCFGADKMSYADRIAWVGENHDEIVRCALEPMEQDTLWRTLKAKERWLALAAAFEYTSMCVEGEDFESHLPVGLDGCCNGLQHLSTWIRDAETAYKVSVLPADEPQDIYREVKDETNARLLAPTTDAQKKAQALWVNRVERAFVKRPTMTLPYALSDRGRNAQIAEELQAHDEHNPDNRIAPDETEDDSNPIWTTALQLSPVVLETQEGIMPRPLALLRYLKRLCDLVVTSGADFEWHTPITNFHAVLRYFQTNDKKFRRYWYNGSKKKARKIQTMYDKRCKAGAKRAVAASVTHSMDACHLQLTVHDLWEQGINDFYLCHDSIGVHAAHCGKAHDALQRTFVAMYSSDFIERLEQSAISTLKRAQQEGVIESDAELHKHKTAMLDGPTFDIEEVLKSPYIFS